MRPRALSGLLLISHSLFLTSSVCVSQTITTKPTSATLASGEHNELPVLQYLGPILASANKASRIYYKAVCPSETPNSVAFPRVDVQAPSGRGTDLTAIRSIFRDSSDVAVGEDTPGIIRIWIGNVADTILHTRITHLSLDSKAQYDPRFAMFAIEAAPDVQAAMKELHIGRPTQPYSLRVPPPSEERTHLPAEISNLTLDQALDMVATTWNSIILYGACSEPGMYKISYAPRI